jgi:hypothetical protein
MPARRKRAREPVRAANAAAVKLTSLCLDMEEPLNEALDAAHAIRFIGHGLREFASPAEAGAVAATAWLICQKLEALQRMWHILFKGAAQTSRKAQ